MNKLFKGAIAGAAGVALLLGGAGTFALWNSDADVGTDTTIDAGHLMFGTVPDGSWYVDGSDTALSNSDVESVALVPGDVLVYKVANVPVIAHGTHLQAKLGFDWDNAVAAPNDGSNMTAATASTEFLNALEVTYAVTDPSGNPVGLDADNTMTITGTDSMDPQLYDITVTITFNPATAQHVAMGGEVNLSGFDLTLQQVPTSGQATIPPTATP